MIASSRLFRPLLPGGLIAILAVLVMAPLLTLVYASLTRDAPFATAGPPAWTLAGYRDLWSASLARAAANTLMIAVLGSALAMACGGGMAWLQARTDVPARSLVHLAGLTPLLVSILVAGVCWSLLGAGRSGYLNLIFRSLGLGWHIELQSVAGIAFVLGLYYAPYPYIFITGALNLVHPDLEEAAALHGGTVPRILWRITFPLVKPAVIGSALLVMVLMGEDFPVPQLLGNPVGIETISIRIYNLMTHNPALTNQAAALSILLTLGVCVLVYTQRRLIGGRDYRTVTGKGMQLRRVPLGVLRWPALAAVCLYFLVAVVLPLLALLESALRQNLYVANAAALFDFSRFSPRALTAALLDPAVRLGFANSVKAAAITALLGAVLFFLLAYTVNRTRLPGRRLLEYLAMMPLAVPALVMGLGILWTWVAAPLPVYGTLAILVIAFMARFMPQGYRAVAINVAQIHDDLDQAALVAGATQAQAMRRIVLPLVRGGVVASAFLVLVLAAREVTASLFLYTFNTRVLSIVVYEGYENGSWSMVAAVSLIYTGLLVALTMTGRRWLRAAI